MRLLRHISLLFALMLFVGCSTDEHTAELIDRAERIVEEHPDSALTIMQSIDPSTIHGDEDMARYRLVYSEALYYNEIKNEANFSKDVQSLVNESLSRRIPVIVGALGSAYGHASGHCWVIDGCKYIHNQQDWVNHINLGWGGSGDGWYFRDCFKSEDVYEDANSRTKDITISPLASEDEFKYTWMFNIIIVQ